MFRYEEKPYVLPQDKLALYQKMVQHALAVYSEKVEVTDERPALYDRVVWLENSYAFTVLFDGKRHFFIPSNDSVLIYDSVKRTDDSGWKHFEIGRYIDMIYVPGSVRGEK